VRAVLGRAGGKVPFRRELASARSLSQYRHPRTLHLRRRFRRTQHDRLFAAAEPDDTAGRVEPHAGDEQAYQVRIEVAARPLDHVEDHAVRREGPR